MNSSHEYTGSFWNLFQPYGIMTGVTLAGICVLHGATFITMKTTDELRTRAWRLAKLVAPVTMLLVLAFISWTHVEHHGGAFLSLIELIACIAVIGAVLAVWGDNQGWAFTATTITIATCILTLFVDLYPNLMISSTNPAYSLTVNNSASPAYTLKIMSVIAVVLLPIVLGYQAWTYYVFRQRISVHHFRPASAPVAAAASGGAPMQRPPAATSGPQAAVPTSPPVPAGSQGSAPGAPGARGSRRGGRHRHWRG